MQVSVLISLRLQSAISQGVFDGNCVVLMLMGEVGACWGLGHHEWMTEMGKHFGRLKFCGWKTTWFVLLNMVWTDKPNMRTHTQTHRKETKEIKSIQMYSANESV